VRVSKKGWEREDKMRKRGKKAGFEGEQHKTIHRSMSTNLGFGTGSQSSENSVEPKRAILKQKGVSTRSKHQLHRRSKVRGCAHRYNDSTRRGDVNGWISHKATFRISTRKDRKTQGDALRIALQGSHRKTGWGGTGNHGTKRTDKNHGTGNGGARILKGGHSPQSDIQ